ncbi:MAG: hypothetical protein EG824_13400 [Deltaproteobacteria bacterium]|nr:hypothetical protein [Deltaproteobacteria bacterium]
MNERIGFVSRTQAAVLTMALTLLISVGSALAEGPIESSNTAMLPPPAQEDQLILKRRLQAAKGDIEAFRVFAENFRKNGDMKTLAQLRSPVDDFLDKHVDNLLAQNTGHATLETTRLTAEIMFIKTRLFMSMDRNEDARNTVAEIKKRFGSYQEISVELPDKTTTLDEGIRQLDAELAKIATAK